MDGAFDSLPESVKEFQNYMSEFEYWALTIKMSPQSCKEESQYPWPTGLQMIAALLPPWLSN